MSKSFTNMDDDLTPLALESYDPSFFDIQIMKVDELADFLKISNETVYRMAKRNEIPSLRIGKAYRFFLPDILQWARNGGKYGNKAI
jgi:excisionase family DNA binding protein